MNFRSVVKLNRTGFTLFEVLIAMVILVFIALSINEATMQTYRLRDVLLNEGDFYNGIRLSLDVVQRDVSMMYSPGMLVEPRPAPSPGTQAEPDPREFELQSGELAQATTFWGPAMDLSGIRPMRFQGDEKKISFVGVSHVRIYKDSKESEFSKITYSLEPDDNPPERSPEEQQRYQGTEVLVKSESINAFNVDDTRDPFNRKYVLLSGVKSLKFRFYSRAREQWFNQWDSEGNTNRGTYPDIIEMSVDVIGPANLRYEASYKIHPEAPLNGLSSRF